MGFNEILSLGNIKEINLKDAIKKINSNKILLTLFKYGPMKLFLSSNYELNEKYTYGKCGFCNLLLKNLN